MSEKKENIPDGITWRDIHHMYSQAFIENKVNAEAREKFASEIIADAQSKIAKMDIWFKCMIGLTAFIALVAFGFGYKNDSQWRKTIKETNKQWIDYLTQYDFVSLDGTGTNYYNSDIGGDVNNGATSQETEKSK